MSEALVWNPAQRRAIEQRGCDLLVAASAGTGKTAVLSSRCLALLTEAERRSGILNMLILTFTDAAAQEMATRIRRQLSLKAASEPRYRYLQREVLLLPSADISTLHAFCKRLITDHFHVLGLDPGFRLLDADEQGLLKTEALEETLEWAWQEPDLLGALPELFQQRRVQGRRGFAAAMIDIHDFLEGQVAPERWCESALALAREAECVDGPYARAQWATVGERLVGVRALLDRARNLVQEGGASDTAAMVSLGQWVEDLSRTLEGQEHEDCVALVKAFEKPRVMKPKGCDEERAQQVQTLVKDAVDAVAALNGLALFCEDYPGRMADAVQRQTETLLALTRRFSETYRRLKQRSNALDFSDLEHLALRLLVTSDPKDPDKRLPTETAMALRRQYHHLFVDEYQDINAVQEALISALARGDNLFVVGDVKQSIYAFRGARPRLFLDRLSRAVEGDDPAPGRALRVDLTTNFRSTPGILTCVNHLFTRLMTQDSADMAYDERARFSVPAAPAEGSEATRPAPCVECHILEEPGPSGEEDDGRDNGELTPAFSARERQAALVARRIRRLMGLEGGEGPVQVFDRALGRRRAIRFGDIAILMRSPAKRVQDYLRVLRSSGIPATSPGAAGYFEATEIADMLSLLKTLDNPRRDIEFVSVLRGAWGGVTDSELAEIVLQGRQGGRRLAFTERVALYIERGADAALVAKLRQRLAQLERWRRAAREGSLADTVWQILSDGGILALAQAMPGADLRRANLLKFHDRAIQFEGFASSRAGPSLRRFVEFIEQLQEAGADWSSAEPPATDRDAVQITSVHKSKGLEFPVVILAELNSPFNRKDAKGDLLLSAEHGLGLQVVEPGTGLRLPSRAHQVIAEEKQAMALAEELRVLYVAVTRARERLILVGSSALQKTRALLAAPDLEQSSVDVALLRAADSVMEWVILAFADQRELWECVGLSPGRTDLAAGLLSASHYDEAAQRELSLVTPSPAVGPAGSEEQPPHVGSAQLLAQALDWQYPYAALTRVPAKRTVSQLVHGEDRAETFDAGADRQPLFHRDHEAGPDRRRVGTATHALLAAIGLEGPIDEAALQRCIESQIDSGAMDEEAARWVEKDRILEFFASPLGKMARDPANRVVREWPFTIRVPGAEGQPDASAAAGGDSVIVQGIADMVIHTAGGVVVIDFKTDRVGAEQVQDRVVLYREQLLLYGRGVENVLGLPVTGLWLYFLAIGEAVEL